MLPPDRTVSPGGVTSKHDVSMPGRLILWDIDGTLVSCGPAGRLALETGAARAAGLASVPAVVMSGKTDPQIITEILTAAGVAEAERGQLLPLALVEAERALAASRDRLANEGVVHPGVRELLAALEADAGVHQTLVTGNLSTNAALKVGLFGLDVFLDLPVGAYGSDHADRDCLVPIALGRVRRERGADFAPEQVWVVGDTGNDLRCARAAGVRCLLVGTGSGGGGDVASLGADAFLEHLGDTDQALDLLLGSPPGG